MPIVMSNINNFRYEFAFLSNFYECDVTYNGVTFCNSEAAFQAQKSLDINERNCFAALDPSEAKRRGRNVKLRSDWEAVKDDIMLNIIRAKFLQNQCLAKMLVDTGTAYLCEGNTWGDSYWGVCNGNGQNKLGKFLMVVRDELAHMH